MGMSAQRITKRVVDGLKAGVSEYTKWDAQLPGFGVRVRPSGAMSYVVVYRAGSGRAAPVKRFTIGAVGKLTPEQARAQARGLVGSVARGHDPAAERRRAKVTAENTLRSVAENYLARKCSRMRTLEARRATLERLVYPTLGARQIESIKRSEIISLLDTIEDDRGPRMATVTLDYLRLIMHWHSTRADDFRSPIIKGMGRGDATKRDRVLTDDELRAFWRAAEVWEHPFSRLLRFTLLTATRRNEAANMRWSEIDGEVWTIPAARYKTNIDFELPLSRAALDLLAAVPNLGTKSFVFTTSGVKGIGGFSKFRARFDGLMLAELRKIAEGRGDDPAEVTLPRWTIHDLRRTARSAMTQAGVPPDHAERALGHVIGGVRGVYDRHGYREEKRRAFEALAAHVDRVVNPQPNVVPLRRAVGPLTEA
jgi:integrase